MEPSHSGHGAAYVNRHHVAHILAKLEAGSVPLAEIVEGKICWGVKTGLNEAFFIDAETRARLIAEDPSSGEVIKPLAVGGDIGRYHIEREPRWLLYLPHGVDIARYPAVERHLAPFRDRLEARATRQAWYKLQQPQEGYVAHFQAEKILFPDIATEPRFSFDVSGLYPSNTVYVLPTENPLLLAVLNSTLSHFYFQARCAALEGEKTHYLRFFEQYVREFPVPSMGHPTPPATLHELEGWLRSLYFKGLRRAGLEPEIPEEIRALGPKLGEVDGVETVLLIGSWARGQAGGDSDVDLVVIQRENGSRTERHGELRAHLGKMDRAVDLVLYTPQEFARMRENEASFAADVLQEAVVLFEHG